MNFQMHNFSFEGEVQMGMDKHYYSCFTDRPGYDPLILGCFDRPAVSRSLSSNKKARKPRTTFTNFQVMKMKEKFETQKYLKVSERERLAEELGLSRENIFKISNL